MATTISEDAMTAALVAELCSGRKLMETRQHLRENQAALTAKAMQGHRAIPGLGKAVAEIPAHEYFLIRQKYGEDCWHDRGFVKDFQRLEPTMAANKL